MVQLVDQVGFYISNRMLEDINYKSKYAFNVFTFINTLLLLEVQFVAIVMGEVRNQTLAWLFEVLLR